MLTGDASGVSTDGPRAGVEGPRDFRDAVEGGLRAAIVAISGIWLSVIAWTFVTGPTPPGSWLLLAVVTTTWIAALSGPPMWLRVHVLALIATAWLQALLSDPLALFIDVRPVVPWTLMAALSTGLFFVGRRARPAVAGVALGASVAAAVGALHDGVWQQAWPQIAVLAAFAVGDGMGAAAAAGSMRKAAVITDEATSTLHTQARLEASRKARRAQQLDAQRVLHDTVVNTLGVIRRGIDPDLEPAVRQRCASDARAVSHLWSAPQTPDGWTPGQLAASLGDWAVELGLRLDVTVTQQSPQPLPEQVATAALAACKEALVNVSRHSGVSQARLLVTWDGSTLAVEVADAGRGWSGEVLPGHGLDVSVRQPAMAAGMQVSLDSGTSGTAVHLRWDAPEHHVVETVNADRALATAAVGVGLWITAMMAAVTALTWSTASGSLIAVLVLVATIGLGWLAARGFIGIPVGWPLGAMLLLAASFVVVLPARGSGTCAQFGLAWWGADGAIAVLIVLLALTRGWAWPALGAVVLVVSIVALTLAPGGLPPNCAQIPVRLLPLELGFFTMIVIVRTALLRLWRTAAAKTTAANEQRMAAAVATERARAADLRVDAAVDAVLPVLNGIAAGEVDPGLESVKAQCALHEETLRTLLRIGPEPDGVGDLLADTAVSAMRSGITVQLTAVPPEPLTYPPWLPARLTDIVAALPTGTIVMLAAILDEDLATLMLNCDCPVPIDPRPSAEPPGSVTAVHLTDQTLVEICWPR